MGVSRAWMDGGIVASAALFFILHPMIAAAEPGAIPETAAGADSAAAAEDPGGLAGTPQLRLTGRVFARAEADQRDSYQRRLSIPTARLGIEGTLSYLQAVVEADVAERNILQDAYIRVRTQSGVARFYAGQFKAPFLARVLESSWSLPIIGRGVVADMLVKRGGLGGRRLGAMGELKVKHWRGLSAQLGVFEGSKNELGQRTSEDASAHVGFEALPRLKLGAGAYGAQVFQGTPRYGAGVDATWALGHFAITGEALQGRIAQGPFTAALGVATLTLPMDARGRFELEPVVSGEILQLRGRTISRGYAVTGGVNLIFDRRLRVQLEVERAFKPGDEQPGNTFGVQLATRF